MQEQILNYEAVKAFFYNKQGVKLIITSFLILTSLIFLLMLFPPYPELEQFLIVGCVGIFFICTFRLNHLGKTPLAISLVVAILSFILALYYAENIRLGDMGSSLSIIFFIVVFVNGIGFIIPPLGIIQTLLFSIVFIWINNLLLDYSNVDPIIRFIQIPIIWLGGLGSLVRIYITWELEKEKANKNRQIVLENAQNVMFQTLEELKQQNSKQSYKNSFTIITGIVVRSPIKIKDDYYDYQFQLSYLHWLIQKQGFDSKIDVVAQEGITQGVNLSKHEPLEIEGYITNIYNEDKKRRVLRLEATKITNLNDKK